MGFSDRCCRLFSFGIVILLASLTLSGADPKKVSIQLKWKHGYITNRPFLLRKKGVAFNVINPMNYGVDFYRDNFFTTEGDVEKHPVRRQRIRDRGVTNDRC
jgi:hypothetical protein